MLFLTGLRNATDDGSIFLHCFTCSKWNHMLHRTASLLSVIGSTCTRQAWSKAEPPQPASPRLPFSSPGATFWGRLSGRSPCTHWAHLSAKLTWIHMSKLAQWDNCIACPAGRSRLLHSKLSVCKRTRPWHRVWRATRTQAFLYLLCNCDVWTWKFTGAAKNQPFFCVCVCIRVRLPRVKRWLFFHNKSD